MILKKNKIEKSQNEAVSSSVSQPSKKKKLQTAEGWKRMMKKQRQEKVEKK